MFTFIACILSAKDWTKLMPGLTHEPCKLSNIALSLLKTQNRGSERGSNLPKVTQKMAEAGTKA